MNGRGAVALLAACVFVSEGRAQVVDPAAPARESAQAQGAGLSGSALVALPATSSESRGFTVAEFVLEATSEEKSATAAVGWKRGGTQFRIGATGPLSGEKKPAFPLALDGLGSGASLSLAFSKIAWPGSSTAQIEQVHGMCAEILAGECKRDSALCYGDTGSLTQKDLFDLCDTKRCDQLTGRKRKACEDEAPHPFCSKDPCRYSNMPFMYRASAEQLLGLNRRIWFWGGELKVQRPSFNYLDPTTLEARVAHREGLSGVLRVGVLSDALGYVIASVSQSKAFSPAGSAVQVCRSIPGAEATSCAEAVLGGPTEKRSTVLALEIRKFFANGAVVAPVIQWDRKTKTKSVSVPIYFLRAKSGGPAGGVRLGWRSDTGAATLSVFAGAVLGVQ